MHFFDDPFFCHLPFLAGILIFLTLHLDLTSARVTASCSDEVLVAVAIEPSAADPVGIFVVKSFHLYQL